MANTTTRGAAQIHGTNPQFLIETVIRSRIYDALYWKEHCFALNSASFIDNAIALKYIGGTFANTQPTEFLCLVLKLLQLQPEREIVLEYLRADEFKYLRAVAAFYVRLTFDALNVYEVLEPLLEDYRKLRVRSMDGAYSITTMDAFADALLNDERVCEIQLPRLTQRRVLEDTEGLIERRSKLGRALGVFGEEEDPTAGPDMGDDEDEREDESERYVSRSPSRSESPDADGTKSQGRARSLSGSGSDAGRFVSRSPSRSPEPTYNEERIEGDL